MTRVNLADYGIKNTSIKYQLTSDKLHQEVLDRKLGIESSQGAIVIKTGEFTGRSPEDRFIVKDIITENSVWWDGKINLPFDSDKFDHLYKRVTEYLSGKELYVRDAYACASPEFKLNIRVINEYPWSNLFVYNMFLRPTQEELSNFTPEWKVINAPNFKADPEIDGTRQHNFTILNFKKKIALIGGTGYTGEVKKGIFSALNFILPKEHNVFPMHCSANVGKEGDTALFFGLSGTGKTTLSADPNRYLIGDDEHGWTPENSIFNFEGGCYAKVINISAESEPNIYAAIRKGAILENVVFKENTNEVDYENDTITQNTRVSYPIDFIPNIQKPSLAKNPKNIFFLTYDAFGILPPISKLTSGQAAYHFISGYTSKVAGTEEGIAEPQTTFSACFGAPFMPLHPTEYGAMLSEKIEMSGANVWLLNTGLIGGAYGVGKRMSLRHTRSLITAALENKLEHVTFDTHKVFGIQMPQECPEVPSHVLNPRNTWSDKVAYDIQANALASKFKANFKQFEHNANQTILEGAPKVKV
ncbi:MAG: phosphoenolpyruvate carboxykinase (ATP) [Flavobacteriales bacterium]